MKRRFASISEDELQEKRRELVPPNTEQSNKGAANILREFLKEKEKDNNFEKRSWWSASQLLHQRENHCIEECPIVVMICDQDNDSKHMIWYDLFRLPLRFNKIAFLLVKLKANAFRLIKRKARLSNCKGKLKTSY